MSVVRLCNMSEPQTHRDVPPETSPHSTKSRSRAGRGVWAGLVLALIATVLMWITSYVGPLAARQAAARADYDNLYTVSIIGLGAVVVLSLIAVILGMRGVRKPAGNAMAGAAIGIGVIQFLGVLVTFIVSTQFTELIY